MHFIALTTLTALVAAPFANTLGLNCRGSSECSSKSSTPYGEFTMLSLQQGFRYSQGQTFTNGQQLACAGYICAFLQGAPGPKTGQQIVEYLSYLTNHDCHVCGSYPTEPGNDVSKGQLTVNFVSKPDKAVQV